MNAAALELFLPGSRTYHWSLILAALGVTSSIQMSLYSRSSRQPLPYPYSVRMRSPSLWKNFLFRVSTHLIAQIIAAVQYQKLLRLLE